MGAEEEGISESCFLGKLDTVGALKEVELTEGGERQSRGDFGACGKL